MSGCDSRNSPMVGSRVKPCPPCPVVYTSIVLEPYRMQPAAISFLPAWRESATPAGPFFLLTRRWIDNRVPIVTLTALVVEPCSGPDSATDFPGGVPRGGRQGG